ncbi:hypothetical protein JJC03_04420 [Flavobacterium oreochromis]|uniref:Uncharacterized protein n=1 Tax=Flavobacterium columnare TaxID=996 RepID=A0A437UBP7_9FLAO|nr:MULTISPECIES: hypothetical protein [Flavobacterium]QYS87184.1 hypothetical protein JJC03_04355 [Flavobacterium oreochromis]QYS87196.1 hypothetical protein JJC03_04420 [Flavobacterium oreochromis]RVU91052.1 hypothetical protein EH230_09165 [Flavobacterium columnare]
MEIRKEVLELKNIGVMPNHDDDVDDSVIEDFENKLGFLGKNLNLKEAEILITLFPRESCFGLEWTLLHLIESLFNQIDLDEYEKLISKCNSSEWRDLLISRVENWKNQVK